MWYAVELCCRLPCIYAFNFVVYVVWIFEFRSSRFGENLEHALPSLTELILTSNNIQELVGDDCFHHDIKTALFISVEYASTFYCNRHLIIVLRTKTVTYYLIEPFVDLLQGDLDPLATVKTLTLLRYVILHLLIDHCLVVVALCTALFPCTYLQSAEESCHQQEALQALCHQQNPTNQSAWFPESEAEGKWWPWCRIFRYHTLNAECNNIYKLWMFEA